MVLSRIMRVSKNAVTTSRPCENSFSFRIAHANCFQSWYLHYDHYGTLLQKVFILNCTKVEVVVVEVHEDVLDCIEAILLQNVFKVDIFLNTHHYFTYVLRL